VLRNLRSIYEIIGYHIHADDGEIGLRRPDRLQHVDQCCR